MPEHVRPREPVAPSLSCQVAKILGPSSSTLGVLHLVFYLEKGKRAGASGGHTVIPAAGWNRGCPRERGAGIPPPGLWLSAPLGGLGMGGGGGARQPPARLDPAGRLLAVGGCAPLPPPAGPSPGTWTGGHWEGQVEAKGSAGLIKHPFPLLRLFSQPFPPLPCICAHPLRGCLWCRGLCRAWQPERCCGCAGLSRLDAAAVTAVEMTWDGFLLYLPCAGTAPTPQLSAGLGLHRVKEGHGH